MEEKPNYFAIIPAEIRYDDRLRANEKLLYGEITALTYKTGECWASNNYFSQLYGTSNQAISKWILDLKKYGYVDIEYVYKGKEIEKRVIKVSTYIDTYQQKDDRGINKCLGGYQQKFKENNTSINNTSINNNIRGTFKKPTIDELKDYIKEKDLNVDAEYFLDYYDSNGWMVGKSKMKDWKATARRWNRMHKKEDSPVWMNKDIKKEEVSDEEYQELKKMMEEYK